MEATTTQQSAEELKRDPVSSFAKALFLGEIHEDMVFPWPQPDSQEQDKVRALIAAAHAIAGNLDNRKIEEDRWIGDDVIRELGEAGLCGLYVPEEYGGQGLSQTGYARVFETFAQIDSTLSIILGVHQSIGFKAIAMFGSDAQKERFLPELASGRKLAGYALPAASAGAAGWHLWAGAAPPQPNAGPDALPTESRAGEQPDGSWFLNGQKRSIGNGSKGPVFTTF